MAHRLSRRARRCRGVPRDLRPGPGRLSTDGRVGSDGPGVRRASDPGRRLRIGQCLVGQSRAEREHRHRRLCRPHPRLRTVPPRVRRPRALTRAERRALILILGFLTFASVYASVVMAPVLTQIAAEFGISTGAAGLVVAALGAPGIVVAVLAGPYSDRFGRKRFLVAGSAVMGVFTLLAAFATSFPVLVATRMIAGVGGSVIFPNSNATLGDNFPYGERSRAVATVIGLNTMASIVGVPLAGIIAEATTWRASVGIVGVLSIAAAVLLYFRLRPAQTRLNESRAREPY